MANQIADASTPNTENFTVKRHYLTEREVERLMDTARKHSRHGHRDATMILVAYRHGLRASELCDLQWQQIELDQGRLHVRRVERHTRRSELLANIGHIGSDADAEDETTFCDLIESRHLVCQEDWIA